jgi:hypothetical protein
VLGREPLHPKGKGGAYIKPHIIVNKSIECHPTCDHIHTFNHVNVPFGYKLALMSSTLAAIHAMT